MDCSASELRPSEIKREATALAHLYNSAQYTDVKEQDCFQKTVKLNEWKLSEQTLKSLQEAQQFAQGQWDSPRGLSALYEKQQRMRHFNPSSYFGGVECPDTELLDLLEDPRLSDMFKSLSKQRKVFPTLSTEEVEDTVEEKVTNISSPRSTQASSLLHKFQTDSPQIDKFEMKAQIGPRLKPPLCPTLSVVKRNAVKCRRQIQREKVKRRGDGGKCSLFQQRTQEFNHSLETVRDLKSHRALTKSRHKKQMSLGRGGRTFEFLLEEEQNSQ